MNEDILNKIKKIFPDAQLRIDDNRRIYFGSSSYDKFEYRIFKWDTGGFTIQRVVDYCDIFYENTEKDILGVIEMLEEQKDEVNN